MADNLDYVLIGKPNIDQFRTWTRSDLEILIRSIVADELSKLDPECEGVKRAVDGLIEKLDSRPLG